MYTILTAGLVTMTITTAMMLLASLLYKKKQSLIEKKDHRLNVDLTPNSPPEPLFNSLFLIAVIFLMFDVEIVLLPPAAITLTTASIMPWTIVTMTFLLILLVGLYHEWNQGSLEWPA